MSKRFTETEKWRDAWFRQLKPIHKCLWQYLVDNCDQSGVIDVDWELASFQIGARLCAADLNHFGRQIKLLPSGKVWVVKFIPFQYGKLSADCKPHSAVLAAMDRHGITLDDLHHAILERVSIGLPNPSLKGSVTLQDKDKDKDKDKSTGVLATEEPMPSPEMIYSAYPRKVAKQSALRAIEKAAASTSPGRLLERTQAFAAAVALWSANDLKYVPHPATWYNQGRYEDDPATWERGKQLPPRDQPQRTESVWELQQREAAIRQRMRDLSEGHEGQRYVGMQPGSNTPYEWTDAGKAEYERLRNELAAVKARITGAAA